MTMDVELIIGIVTAVAAVFGGVGVAAGRKSRTVVGDGQPAQRWNPNDSGQFTTGYVAPPPHPPLPTAAELLAPLDRVLDRMSKELVAPIQTQVTRLELVMAEEREQARQERAFLRDQIARLHTMMARLEERQRRHDGGPRNNLENAE